jgi:HSP20 family molecular chaperone IbpA
LSEWPTSSGTPAALSPAKRRNGRCPEINFVPQLAVFFHATFLEEIAMLTNRTLNSTLDRMMSLNRALDQAFNTAWPTDSSSRVWVPALDVVEKHDAYLVVAELPGVDQSQIELSFEQNVLTIRGTKDTSYDTKGGELRVYAAERVTGAFERSIRLPEFVDGERISAEFRNGLLMVTIPKAQAAQPRKIEITSPTATHELTA